MTTQNILTVFPTSANPFDQSYIDKIATTLGGPLDWDDIKTSLSDEDSAFTVYTVEEMTKRLTTGESQEFHGNLANTMDKTYIQWLPFYTRPHRISYASNQHEDIVEDPLDKDTIIRLLNNSQNIIDMVNPSEDEYVYHIYYNMGHPQHPRWIGIEVGYHYMNDEWNYYVE